MSPLQLLLDYGFTDKNQKQKLKQKLLLLYPLREKRMNLKNIMHGKIYSLSKAKQGEDIVVKENYTIIN